MQSVSRNALVASSSDVTSLLKYLAVDRVGGGRHVASSWIPSAFASTSTPTSTSTSTPTRPTGSKEEERGDRGEGSSSVESATDTFNLIPASKHLIQVHACLPDGFLVHETRVEGSVIAYRDLLLRWAPASYGDVTIESLAPLLDIVSPPPDLLVLGCGAGIRQVDPALMRALMDRFVAVEALDTKNAVSTFNILNAEGRAVVGAFLPTTL